MASIENLLLQAVAPDERQVLLDASQRVMLERGEALIRPYSPIETVYFPLSALGSLVTLLEDGSSVEAGTVGREGMIGVPVLFGAASTPMQTLVQVPGEAFSTPAAVVIQVFREGGTLQSLLNRYIHTLFVIASQSAACNRKHRIDQRLARWLLMSSDGIGGDEIGITHEFLAAMLGVRRSGVSEAAAILQEEGLIDYGRGSVTILNRPLLEAAACECYGVVRSEVRRLFQ